MGVRRHALLSPPQELPRLHRASGNPSKMRRPFGSPRARADRHQFPTQLTSRPRLAKRVNSGWKVISTVPVAPERCFSMISSAIPFFS